MRIRNDFQRIAADSAVWNTPATHYSLTSKRRSSVLRGRGFAARPFGTVYVVTDYSQLGRPLPSVVTPTDAAKANTTGSGLEQLLLPCLATTDIASDAEVTVKNNRMTVHLGRGIAVLGSLPSRAETSLSNTRCNEALARVQPCNWMNDSRLDETLSAHYPFPRDRLLQFSWHPDLLAAQGRRLLHQRGRASTILLPRAGARLS